MPCNSKRVAAGLGVATVVAIGLLYAYPGHGERHGAEHFTTPFFRKLAAARADRKAKVIAYFSAATRVAEHIADDRLMVDAFVALHGQAEPPDPRQDLALDVHYVSEYGEFYDILLVDRSGRVFHTMRRESDYRANLFEGPLASTKLARSLPDAGQVTFVDYEPYPPSDEPAAFFIVPVHGSATAANEPAGWFVLQCPLNKLNSIVADRRGLGRTGEVYLVNTEQRMVTESRFHRDPADLRLRVDTEAVTTALEFGAGEQVIRDYRGERVLSSFERFEVLGTKWVVVAEIDEAEAITEYYKEHKGQHLRGIAKAVRAIPIQSGQWSDDQASPKRVDTNEYARAEDGEALQTSGVSTCTAIAAVLPGRFGYLAHVGPSDQIYGEPDLGHNDCLGDMLRRMQRYDVYPYELPELRFTIVAVHDSSYAAAIDRLLAMGVELSQIRFAYNPRAQYANVGLAPSQVSALIEWVLPGGEVIRTTAASVENLGSVVKRIGADGPRPQCGRISHNPTR